MDDSSNHLDPQLSMVLICWFIFQVKKIVSLEAKAGCSSGDSVLQELLTVEALYQQVI